MWKRFAVVAIALLAISSALLAAGAFSRTLVVDLIEDRTRATGARIEAVSIGGTQLAAIVVHEDNQLTIPSVPVFPGAVLTVGIGVREEVWDQDGDGVLFQVHSKRGKEKTFLFSRYIDPKSRPEHRRWIAADIPLAEILRVGHGLPSRVDLVLTTSPGLRGNALHDAPVWADLKVEKPALSWPSFLRTRPPNVLLVSLDTLRADHVGAFGYRRETTPNLDRIASRGVRFHRAYAPANHTLESHMSALTGLYPTTHGVRPGTGKRQEMGIAPLPADRVTLAETLQGHGYLTGGFAYDCVWLKRGYGFGQGFEKYVVRGRDAATMNDTEIFPWLESHHDEPFFLFVHYYDIHSDWKKLPYDAPSRFREKFERSYSGKFDGCGNDVCATRYLMELDTKKRPIGEPELAHIRSLYDAGVEATDFEVGRLMDKLESLGVLENTIVVVMSDHGEEFREHGRFIHNQIYEEILRVPLIFTWPSVLREGGQSFEPVGLIDVMPTILDLVGVVPETPIQGRSLFPHMRNGRLDAKPVFVVGRDLAGVVQWPWKLIRAGKRSGELFNLNEDPGETVDKSRDEPGTLKDLQQLLSTWTDTSPSFQLKERSAEVDPSEADLDRLKSLGYLP